MEVYADTQSHPAILGERLPASDEKDPFFLADLKPGDVIFRSPEAAFRGWADITDARRSDTNYSKAVSELTAFLKRENRATDVMFGAIPFSRSLPGQFFVPRQRR